LEGISLSQPQPKIPPELIKFLGKSFNSWHIAIPLLESHVIIFPDESRCFDALAELYKQVRGWVGVCVCVCVLTTRQCPEVC
jgi:transformation/transcription domain-associated protein